MGLKALPAILIGVALTGCAGKPLPDPCYEEPSSGQCRAAHQRWFYDPGPGECRSFIWGGCSGRVPFNTREECVSTCEATTREGDDAATVPEP